MTEPTIADLDLIRSALSDQPGSLAEFEKHLANDRDALGYALAANIGPIRLSAIEGPKKTAAPYQWTCPNCGVNVQSWTKPPALSEQSHDGAAALDGERLARAFIQVMGAVRPPYWMVEGTPASRADYWRGKAEAIAAAYARSILKEGDE